MRWADVLVTNFPPQTRASWAWNTTKLVPLNPRLIYADVTGFGEDRTGRASARLRRDGVLGAQRPDGPHPSKGRGAGHERVRVGRSLHGDHAVRRDHDRAVPAGEDRPGRTCHGLAARRRRLGGEHVAASRTGRGEAPPTHRPVRPTQRAREHVPHGGRPLDRPRLRQREQGGPALPQGHRTSRGGGEPALRRLPSRRAHAAEIVALLDKTVRHSVPGRVARGARRSRASRTESSRRSKSAPRTPSSSPTGCSYRSTTAATTRT